LSSATALLLVGSPRGRRSTSASLGAYLLARLEGFGLTSRTLRLTEALGSPAGEEAYRRAVGESDLVILSFPLYWDSLPALVVRALEVWRDGESAAKASRRRRFVALCNSGFPEASQSRTALGICQRFAAELGLEWAGGLALGGGAALDGCALEEAGGRARHARTALDLTAAALAAEKLVPQGAVDGMARPFVPAWAYTVLGSWGWRRLARSHGTQRQLDRRPYER
jgi:hypothetical protein